jgi:hypothetical protein
LVLPPGGIKKLWDLFTYRPKRKTTNPGPEGIRSEIGQFFFLGKLPVNAQIGAYANVVKPDFGPDRKFRIQVQFLLPISIFKGGE